MTIKGKHFHLLTPTPIQDLGFLPGGQHLFIKRDDLLGFSFGGNKCRIAAAFLRDMKEKGGDFLISYGSKKSNLNRVMAAMAKSQGLPCLIIYSHEEREEQTFNAQIIEAMGISSVGCAKSQVAGTVERVLKELQGKGYKPYYIYGNQYGEGNEEAARRAYVDAYREISQWQKSTGIFFDNIFHASGTGMTQGGLIAGREVMGGREEIIGISTAREYDTGVRAVGRYAGEGPEKIQFETAYRKGGYGCYDREIESVIQNVMERWGIALDPTYTGKAWNGMLGWLEKNGTGKENVLFIHTGGLPLYFDYLRSKEGKS